MATGDVSAATTQAGTDHLHTLGLIAHVHFNLATFESI